MREGRVGGEEDEREEGRARETSSKRRRRSGEVREMEVGEDMK